MNIVFLDKKTLGQGLDLSPFDKLGTVTMYDFSALSEVPERVKDADIIVVNKTAINEQTIYTAKNLKLVCVSATGTNNLDKPYLDRQGIAWRNVAGYSTESVAQHTFAILFYLMEHLGFYEKYVKSGKYINDTQFTHYSQIFHQLSSQTWGIIGLGAIGRRVADIAKMFGAKVIYYSASHAPAQEGYEQVDFDTLLSTSDIISIHAPLNEYTEGLMNAEAFSKMKKNAILINVGRGPIIVEQDLADALNADKIAAAGLDVLTVEPMAEDNPLLGVEDQSKLFLTPHVAWASIEARTNLMNIIVGQIKEFFGL